MIINASNLRTIYTGLSAAYAEGIQATGVNWPKIAMKVPSSSAETEYGWLAALPRLREWIGDRQIHNLGVHGYALRNRKFESTIAIKREEVEDDRFGMFSTVAKKMGQDAARHSEELIFGALAAGFTTSCYDKQYFFDADHPVGGMGDEIVSSVSNVQAGSGPAWFLLDCSQVIKSMVFQERAPYDLTALDAPTDSNVFHRDEYLYGVRARCNAGFGLWQLAFASKAVLSAENYEAARAAMQSFKGDNGRPLGVSPTHLVVPSSLEGAGRRLLKAVLADGSTNEWAGSAELIVTPFLI
jgi:phage major head subunit gpT-like protein